MAIKQIEIFEGGRLDLSGLSSDTKPTTWNSRAIGEGSSYYEVDTTNAYIYHDGTWYAV